MENKEYIIAMPYFSNGGGVNFPNTKGKCPCFPASYYKGMSGIGARPFVMEIEKHIIKPYTMNGGGYRYIGQGKVPTICAMYHNVFSTFPEKPYIMEIDKTEICVAMRGRNPENPSDRTAGVHLEQRLEANTQGKTNCLTTVSKDNLIFSCLTPKRTEYGKQIRKQYEAGEIREQRKNIQQLEPREDGKTGTLTTVQKDNMIMERTEESIDRIRKNIRTAEGKTNSFLASSYKGAAANGMTLVERKPIQLNHSDKEFGNQPRQQNRVYDEEGISPAVMANMSCGSHAVFNRCRIRRLTPTECARLQSIPDWYEWKGKFPDGKVKDTSDTQIYKLCGNGWNVEVIKHIFSFINIEAYEQVCQANS